VVWLYCNRRWFCRIYEQGGRETTTHLQIRVRSPVLDAIEFSDDRYAFRQYALPRRLQYIGPGRRQSLVAKEQLPVEQTCERKFHLGHVTQKMARLATNSPEKAGQGSRKNCAGAESRRFSQSACNIQLNPSLGPASRRTVLRKNRRLTRAEDPGHLINRLAAPARGRAGSKDRHWSRPALRPIIIRWGFGLSERSLPGQVDSLPRGRPQLYGGSATCRQHKEFPRLSRGHGIL
jgi:hypothetical protein